MLFPAFLSLPVLVALGLIASLVQTLKIDQGQAPPSGILTGGRLTVIVIWLMTMTVVPIGTWSDWTHLLWGIQIGMVGMFFSGGLFLVPRNLAGKESGSSRFGWLASLLPLLFYITAGALPLTLIELNPKEFSRFRLTGTPLEGVIDLAAWGLGGALPDYLVPVTPHGEARGVGFLPRAITVSFGASLAAAWLCIAHSVIFLIGRELSGFRRSRIFILLVSPLLVVGGFVADFASLDFEWLRPSYFRPGRSSDCGIWASDVAVMESYGPVLVAALALIALHLFVAWRGRRKGQS